MAKDNNKKESYQDSFRQIYYPNKLEVRTVDSPLKCLSNKKHLLDQLVMDFSDSKPIRFYVYFVKDQKIKLELVSLR
jgi:HKD family nuclease